MKQHRITFNGLTYSVEYCYDASEPEYMKCWFGQCHTRYKWFARLTYWLRVRRERANDAARAKRNAMLRPPVTIADSAVQP